MAAPAAATPTPMLCALKPPGLQNLKCRIGCKTVAFGRDIQLQLEVHRIHFFGSGRIRILTDPRFSDPAGSGFSQILPDPDPP